MDITTIMQLSPDILPNLSTADALIYLGLYALLTFVASALSSVLTIVAWGLTGIILILVMLGIIGADLYFIALILALISIIASAVYTVKNP